MNAHRSPRFVVMLGIAFFGLSVLAQAAGAMEVQANRVVEITLHSTTMYENPFVDIELDAVVTQPDGKKLRVPMFWTGGKQWCLRYASNVAGEHRFNTECSDTTNARLHGLEGKIKVVPNKGQNRLYRHGQIRVAEDKHHFEHADGTPFFWLGDTWWKCLAKRLSWEGFQELAQDRKKKGFTVVQIVAGPYPVFWILAGELRDGRMGEGPWGEVFRYVKEIDSYQRPIATHGGGARPQKREDFLFAYELVGGSHRPDVAIDPAVNNVKRVYETENPTPVIMGEGCYEGHMQNGFRYLQRNMFWKYMLSGAAGHTYGAAGIWHAGIEGDPGCNVRGGKTYDWTTWREGMNYAGSTQVGMGKELLEEYPWSKFEPHPEWAEEGSLAAGIPGDVRFVYQPKRGIYDWNGTVVKGVETDVNYTSYYFDPATGRRFDNGKVKVISGSLADFVKHTQPPLYEDDFDRHAVGFEPQGNAADWKDYGTPTQRKDSVLYGKRGMLSVLEKVGAKDVMVSCASARTDAEAALVVRFQDPHNYIVGIYSPKFNLIFMHDRRDGEWGKMLGAVKVPEDIGPDIQMSMAVIGEYAAFVISNGKETWRTKPGKVSNTESGKTGLWCLNIGTTQEFGRYVMSPMGAVDGKGSTGIYSAPDLPSPQDWVLVMERVKK